MSAQRMGRALVCLSAVLAPGTLAVRMGHAGAPPVLAATSVMNKISLLLKDKSHQSKSGAQRTMHAIHLSTQRVENRETPTVRTSLSSTLTQVVKSIEENVDVQILQDRAQAQTDIDNKVNQVQEDSNLAVTRLGNLVSDKGWFDCVQTELDNLNTWRKAQTDEADAEQQKDKAYDALQIAIPYEMAIPANLLTFSCFPATDTNCESAINDLRSKRREYRLALQAAITETAGKYQDAVSDHKTKLDRYIELRDTIVPGAENEFTQQRAECLVLAHTRQNDICNHLGMNIRNMCEHIDEYDDLNVRVHTREADRQDSWRASYIVQCLLRGVIDLDTFEISDETLAACSDPATNPGMVIPSAAVDFKEQTVRDLQVAPLKADDVSSTSEFKCVDTLVEFTSEWWTGPGGAGYPGGAQNDPSTYVKQTSWEATVQLDASEMPFDFCDDLKPCAEHACSQGSVDMTKVCLGTDCEAVCCSTKDDDVEVEVEAPTPAVTPPSPAPPPTGVVHNNGGGRRNQRRR